MKTKKELNVDFIGEQKPLTKEEENALGEFFERRKALKEKRKTGRKPSRRKKTTA